MNETLKIDIDGEDIYPCLPPGRIWHKVSIFYIIIFYCHDLEEGSTSTIRN